MSKAELWSRIASLLNRLIQQSAASSGSRLEHSSRGSNTSTTPSSAVANEVNSIAAPLLRWRREVTSAHDLEPTDWDGAVRCADESEIERLQVVCEAMEERLRVVWKRDHHSSNKPTPDFVSRDAEVARALAEVAGMSTAAGARRIGWSRSRLYRLRVAHGLDSRGNRNGPCPSSRHGCAICTHYEAGVASDTAAHA